MIGGCGMEYVNIVQGTWQVVVKSDSQEALNLFFNLKKEISLRIY
jgi:hypothetical protein